MEQGPKNPSTRSPRLARSLLVTFSGVDGSGKTTQIENLHRLVLDLGLRARVIAFWNDIVVGTSVREGFVHTVFRSERGVGRPGHPVQRRDKNVQAWYLTLARHFLYFIDALRARRVIRRALRGVDVLIVDRYLYDEYASLSLDSAVSRVFVHTLSEIAPRPNLALLLDADPAAARERKPEYPVDFMQRCRANYWRLNSMLQGLTVIPDLPLPQATAAVENAFLYVVERETHRSAAREQKTAA